MMVKPISPAPLSAASSGVRPVLDVADNVLQHDDRIVHHEADGDREPHQRKVVEAVTEQIHHRECPGQRQRHGDGGDDRRPDGAQKEEDHRDHQDDGDRPGWISTPETEARIVSVRSDKHRHVDRRGDRRLEMRQRRPHLVDRLDHIGAGLFVDRQQDAPACRSPRQRAWCSPARPPPGRCRGCAPVRRCGRQRRCRSRARRRGSDRCHRPRSFAARRRRCPSAPRPWRHDLRPDIFESETERCDLRRIELNADRRLLLSVDRDLGNATDLRKLLGENILGRSRRSTVSGSEADVSARIRIGESAGLTLR